MNAATAPSSMWTANTRLSSSTPSPIAKAPSTLAARSQWNKRVGRSQTRRVRLPFMVRVSAPPVGDT